MPMADNFPHLSLSVLVLTSIPFFEWHSRLRSVFQSIAFVFEVENDTDCEILSNLAVAITGSPNISLQSLLKIIMDPQDIT